MRGRYFTMPTHHSKEYLDEDFEGDLREDIFDGTFTNCGFSKADLRNAVLSGTFVDCEFDGAKLEGAKCTGSFSPSKPCAKD
jgi:uncharacterized protein YjbI with pentapeptide repeats